KILIFSFVFNYLSHILFGIFQIEHLSLFSLSRIICWNSFVRCFIKFFIPWHRRCLLGVLCFVVWVGGCTWICLVINRIIIINNLLLLSFYIIIFFCIACLIIRALLLFF